MNNITEKEIRNAFQEICEEAKLEFSQEEIENMDKERKERAEARNRHFNKNVMPYKFPMLWIKDKCTGSEHLYGTDSHDSLWIDQEGNLQYYNLQNEDGTGGKEGSYEFVNHSDDYGCGTVPHYYVDEAIVL